MSQNANQNWLYRVWCPTPLWRLSSWKATTSVETRWYFVCNRLKKYLKKHIFLPPSDAFNLDCYLVLFSNSWPKFQTSSVIFQTSSLGRLLRHNQTITRLSLQWNCIGLDQVMDERKSLHAKSKRLGFICYLLLCSCFHSNISICPRGRKPMNVNIILGPCEQCYTMYITHAHV